MRRKLEPAYLGSWQPHEWGHVIAEHGPGDIVVITGPGSGPPPTQEPWLLDRIEQLHERGVTVVGYVHTAIFVGGQRMWRPIADILRDARIWRAWYAVDGIFYDEAPTTGGPDDDLALKRLNGLVRAWSTDPRARCFEGRGVPAFNPGTGPISPHWWRMLPAARWVTWEGRAEHYAAQRPAVGPRPHREAHLVYAADVEPVWPPTLGFAWHTWDDLPDPWDRQR